MMTKFHHFFLLSPSSYPLLISVNAGNMFFSALMLMKNEIKLNMAITMLTVISSTFLWWINYSNELNLSGTYSLALSKGLKMSMVLFISSEILFFFSFFWSYYHFFLSPLMELGMSWPPEKLTFFDHTSVPLVNTMLLLASGATVTSSHHYMISSRKKSSQLTMILTISLGLMFTYLQKMEYSASFFSISDSTFGTSFFMLTGFHGIHVMIGTLFLMIILFRLQKLNSTKSESLSFELASWYWHFVDVVWIFLYFSIYYLNA